VQVLRGVKPVSLTGRRINCTSEGRPRHICLSDISPIRHLTTLNSLKNNDILLTDVFPEVLPERRHYETE
ncbi:TPA: hypothetical protein ACQI42_005451, partial [Escherichia coli]